MMKALPSQQTRHARPRGMLVRNALQCQSSVKLQHSLYIQRSYQPRSIDIMRTHSAASFTTCCLYPSQCKSLKRVVLARSGSTQTSEAAVPTTVPMADEELEALLDALPGDDGEEDVDLGKVLETALAQAEALRQQGEAMETLRTRLSEQDEALSGLRAALDESRKQRAKEMEDTLAAIQELEEALAEAAEGVAAAEQLASTEAELNKAKEVLAAEQAQLEEVKKKLDAELAAREQAEAAAEKARHEAATNAAKLAKAQQDHRDELAKLKAKSGTTKQFKGFGVNKDAADKRLAQLQTDLAAAHKSLEDKEKVVKDTQGEVQVLKLQCQKAEDRLQAALQKATSLEEQGAASEKLRKEVDQLQGQLQAAAQEKVKLQEALKNAHEKLVEAKAAHEATMKTFQAAATDEGMAVELSQLRDQLTARESELAQLTEDVRAAVARESTKTTLMARAQQDLVLVEKRKGELEKSVEELTRITGELRMDLGDTKEKLRVSLSEGTDMRAKLEEARKQLEKVRLEAEQLKMDLDEAREEAAAEREEAEREAEEARLEYQQRVDDLIKEYEEKIMSLNRQHDKKVAAIGVENDGKVKALVKEQEDKVAKLTAQHKDEVAELKKKAEAEVKSLSEKAEEKVYALTQSNKEKVEALIREHRDKLESLSKVHEGEKASLLAAQEKQVASLTKEHGDVVAKLKKEREEEVSSLKKDYAEKVDLLTKEHKLKVDSLTKEHKLKVAELTAEHEQVVSDLEADVAAAKKQVAAKAKEAEAAQKEVVAKAKELEGVRKEVEAREKDADVLAREKRLLAERITKLEKEAEATIRGLTGEDGVLAKLKLELGTEQAKAAELASKLEAATGEIGVLREAQQTHAAELSDAAEVASVFAQELERLQGQMMEKEAAATEVRKQLARAQAEAAHQKAQARELEVQVQGALQKQQEASRKCSDLEKALAEAKRPSAAPMVTATVTTNDAALEEVRLMLLEEARATTNLLMKAEQLASAVGRNIRSGGVGAAAAVPAAVLDPKAMEDSVEGRVLQGALQQQLTEATKKLEGSQAEVKQLKESVEDLKSKLAYSKELQNQLAGTLESVSEGDQVEAARQLASSLTRVAALEAENAELRRIGIKREQVLSQSKRFIEQYLRRTNPNKKKQDAATGGAAAPASPSAGGASSNGRAPSGANAPRP